MTSEIEKLTRLRAKVGGPLVDQLLSHHGESGIPLSAGLLAVVNDLLEWEPQSCSPVGHPTDSVIRIRPEQFISGEFRDTADSYWGDVAAGTDMHSGDVVLSCLLALGAKAYPAFLSGSEVDQSRSEWAPLRLRSVPEHELVVSAMRDEHTMEGLWDSAQLVTSFDATETALRFHDPVELLLYGSWRLCLLRGDWSASAFGQCIGEQLNRVRGASGASMVDVPIFFGFSEARLADPQVSISANVRPYAGNLQSCLFSVEDRLDRLGGGFIVERSHPWTFSSSNKSLDIAGGERANQPFGTFTEDDWGKFRHWADCFAVSVASAQTSGLLKPHDFSSPIAISRMPELRWIATADPFYGATSLHFSSGWKGGEGALLDVGMTTVARANDLARIDDESIRTTIRRIRASLEYPRAWRDCLVDAVIAWEAMSGDSRGAVTLKVTSVMAHLIASRGHRSEVRGKLRSLYRRRSEVVHGGLGTVRQGDRDIAVRVALTALKNLLNEHRELVECTDRFGALCLDSN